MADRELKIKVTTDTSGAQRGLNALSGSWTEFNSMLSTAGRAARAVGQAYDATVGAFLEYTDVVGDLSSITGESAENTSRFVTVLGEFGIEMSQITAAGRSMRDEGLVPTLDTLAQLSDQYLALVPGIERVNFLQETFGRQGQEFVDILEQGSAAIRDRSEAVTAGSVLTDEEIAQADELRLTLAGLNTAWTGLMNTLAQVVVPGLLPVVGAVNTLLTSIANGTSIVDQFSAALLRMAEISGRVPGVTIPVGIPAISGRGGVRGHGTGGYLGRGWDLVGDAGPELISPWGEVIPASRTMSMLRGGLIPRHKFAYGAKGGGDLKKGFESNIIGGGGIGTKGFTSNILSLYSGTITGGGGGAVVPAPVIQTLVEEVQQSSAQQSAAVAATIPAAAAAAASEQSRALVAETSRSNAENSALMRQILREIAKLNRTLPVAFRDSVERML